MARRVDPVSRAPIVEEDRSATPFFARQWQNLVDLVSSVTVVEADQAALGARVTAVEDAEIQAGAGLTGGGQIKDAPLSLSVPNDGITNAMLRNSAANSVIGRSANTVGDSADIAATTDGHVLRLAGTVLGFGQVVAAGIASLAVTTAKIAAAAVTNAKLANMAQKTVKGRADGASTGAPQDLTGAQLRAIQDIETTDAVTFGQLFISGSGLSTFTKDATGGGNVLRLVRDSDTAAEGPGLLFTRNSASPANNDLGGLFGFQATNSSAALFTVGQFVTQTLDVTAGSESSRIYYGTAVSGTFAIRMQIDAGVYHPSVTGGDQGDNTINYSAIYDDGVLLCAPLNPDLSQQDWDDLIPDRPEVDVLDSDGKVVGRASQPKPVHRTAKRHFHMLAEGFEPENPEAYVARLRADKAVPGLITIKEWRERMITNGVIDKPSIAERHERTLLALDYMAVAFAAEVEHGRVLEARITALEQRNILGARQ